MDATLLRKSNSSYFYFFARKMLASFALVEDPLIGTWFALVFPCRTRSTDHAHAQNLRRD
jgi:hypothetical protein